MQNGKTFLMFCSDIDYCTCCDLFLPYQDVFQRERGRGVLVLLPEVSLPLSGDQAEGLVAVGLTKTRDGDQPPCVSNLFHKVLSGCGEHFKRCMSMKTGTKPPPKRLQYLCWAWSSLLNGEANSGVFCQTREVVNNAGSV